MSESPLPPEREGRALNYEDDFSWNDCAVESLPDHIVFPLDLNIYLKNRVQDLTAENGALRRTLQEIQERLLEEQSKVEVHPALDETVKDDMIKSLQEKLTQANTKYYESKNACLSLRQELNKAQKLLCSEVGDNVTVASLLNHPGGWRGRAEQIQHLQQKISELQHKLNNSEKFSRSSSVSLDRRNLCRTKSVERERRQQVENLEKELRQAEVALESNKKKLEASRARIKVLENELADTKRNLLLLSDKRILDDQLIETLKSQLKAAEARYRDRELELRSQVESVTNECSSLRNELHSSKLQIEQLRRKVTERDAEIDTLRSGTARRAVLNHQTTTGKIFHGSSLSTNRSYQDPNEYVVLGLAAEAERERLIELVAILNRRLDKERADTNHVSELLRDERSKNAKLKTKLQKLEGERIPVPRVNSGYRSRCSKSLISSSSSKESPNGDQIKYKLELLEEENLALKARLATVQQEKSSDLSTFKQMLDNTKKVFHDALRGKITSGAHSTITV